MPTAKLQFISMCKSVVDFHSANKEAISHIEGVELLFVELQMKYIHLRNLFENETRQLMPLLKENKSTLKKLEKLYVKFSVAFNDYLSTLHVKGKHRKSELIPMIAFGQLSAEQYPSIIRRMRGGYKNLYPFGITEEDFISLEKHVTTIVLSLPMQTLLERTIDDLHSSEKEAISDIEYLLTRQIDTYLKQAKSRNAAVYAAYLAARNLTEDSSSESIVNLINSNPSQSHRTLPL